MNTLSPLLLALSMLSAVAGMGQDHPTQTLEQIENLSNRESFDSVLLFAPKVMENLTSEKEINDLHFFVAVALEKKGELDSALTIYEKLLGTEMTLSREIAVHRNIGNLRYLKADYPGALEKYLGVLPKAEELNGEELIASIQTNLGLVYWKLKKYEEAIEVLDQAVTIRKELQSPDLGTSLSTLANIYYEQGKMDKVLELDLLSLENNLRANNQFRVAVDYNNIGEGYLTLGDINLAEEYFEKALTLRKKINHHHGQISTLVNMSLVAQEKGAMRKAEGLLKQALLLSDSIKARDQKYRVLPYLIQFEEDRGNYKMALTYNSQYIELKDSIYNEQNSRQIEEMIAKYESEKKDVENTKLIELTAAQQAKLDAQRNLQIVLVIAIILVLIVLLVLYRSYKQNQSANIEIKKQRDDLEKLNAAKTRFFSLISHDIRGPLSSINGLTILIKQHFQDKNKNEEDAKMLEMLTHMENASEKSMALTDSLISWAMKEEGLVPYEPSHVNISKLVHANNEMLEPQAMAKKIALQAEIPGELSAWVDEKSFATVLRNLTGNALKFTPVGGKVEIRAHRDNGHVELEVEDSGVGMKKEEIEKLFELSQDKIKSGTKGERGLGLGLNMVNDFVKLNQGEIEVESTPDVGSKFTVRFPLEKVSLDIRTATKRP